jgi:4-hydroxy-2-oxoheptanedioate aldolase
MFLPTPLSAQLFGSSGFDWVVVDLQHGAATMETLPPVIQALQLGGASAVVRVDWNSPASIMRALDMNAAAVIVPMVNTAAEARSAAEATRYPTKGFRSLGRLVGNVQTPDETNDDVLCIVMAETVEAVARIEEIVATPGVDGVFFGPADYRQSTSASGGPPADDALDTVVRAADEAGLFVATIAPHGAGAAALLGRGVRMIAIGSDLAYLRAGTANDVASIRQMVDDVSARRGDAVNG